MARFSKLVHSRRWDLLAPDYAHTVLTEGYGDINASSYAAAARTTDGTTIVVYAPSQRTLRVNLETLSGSNATAWWFNPRDGSVDAGTPLTSSGTHDFTPPTNADWVLVIDDDDAMLPPPGTGTIDGGAESGGTEPQAYVPTPLRCGASAPGQGPSTPWYFVVLGVWALVERRRLRRS